MMKAPVRNVRGFFIPVPVFFILCLRRSSDNGIQPAIWEDAN